MHTNTSLRHLVGKIPLTNPILPAMLTHIVNIREKFSKNYTLLLAYGRSQLSKMFIFFKLKI